MDYIKVTVLQVNKQIKGILLHSGVFMLSDILAHKESGYETLSTDPQLDANQREQLGAEITRIERKYNDMLALQPLDFSTVVKQSPLSIASAQAKKKKKREFICLMRELVDVRTVQADDSQEHFLDMVFGLGEVVEVCGLAGTGKTQICFQLCLNVQIPRAFGGVEGEALFVDTHGDFSVDRMTEMAKNLRNQVLKNVDKDPTEHRRHRDEFSIDKILSRIHFVRILDESNQYLLHQKLEQVVETLPNVKLIVMDTFCEHLRGSDQSYNERRRTIASMCMSFQRVAARHNLSFVISNCMKTGKREFIQHKQPGAEDGQPGVRDFAPAKPEPLFGEDLFQGVTSRVMVERDQHSTEDNIIRGRLIKGSSANHFPNHPTSHFQITEKGIANIL